MNTTNTTRTLLLSFFVLSLGGCGKKEDPKAAANAAPPPPMVSVITVTPEQVTNVSELPGRIEASEHEHGVIVDAIEKQDQLAARLMIIEHIHNARDAWIKYLKKVDA